MTSNLGSDIIQKEEDSKIIEDKITQLVQATFRPEFINRLDQIVLFEKLSEKQISEIIKLQLKRVEENLAKNRKLKIFVDEKAQKLIAELGYDPQYGARPLKRVIQTKILDQIALMIIDGKIKEGQTIKITATDKKTFEIRA